MMSREAAEEYTQSLGQIGSGLWRQIVWADKQGVPAALGLSLEEWVRERLGGYIRLDAEVRRAAVAELRSEGLPQAKIAQVLGVAEATISRDMTASLAVSNETTPQPSVKAQRTEAVPNETMPQQSAAAQCAGKERVVALARGIEESLRDKDNDMTLRRLDKRMRPSSTSLPPRDSRLALGRTMPSKTPSKRYLSWSVMPASTSSTN
jgi:hypothetical protein